VRVAIITQTRALVGGVETYLEGVIPGLAQRHTLAFWSASDQVGDRGTIALPGTVTAWAADTSDAMDRLQAFAPDVLFAHGLDDPALEARVLGVAPAVVVEHNYHGTCISGSKTMSLPHVRACDRRFGPACLALYFPRRCGGLSPVTMMRMYSKQSARLATLGRCAAVVTLSEHMRDEMLRHGLSPERVHVVPPFVSQPERPTAATSRPDEAIQLLFIGRLEPLKGVPRLLDALLLVARHLSRPVTLTVAGDGADRRALEAHAHRVEREEPRLKVRFVGWLQGAGKDRLLAESDAIVMPSVWPEPFGLVGLEAAVSGVPAVAFATGGIGDWLKEDETGCLALAEGARPSALAEAIVRCVGDPDVRARLARGARDFAAQWTIDRHLTLLDGVLSTAARSAAASAHS